MPEMNQKLTRESALERAAALLKKPYSRILSPDEESGRYAAEILEFPGCFAEGATPTETYENLEAAAESWLLAALETGRPVPPPLEADSASGKFALRLPKSLHSKASRLAAADGVSLNQFIVTALAESVGANTAVRAITEYTREVRVLRAMVNSGLTTVGTMPIFSTALSGVSAQTAVHLSFDPTHPASTLSTLRLPH